MPPIPAPITIPVRRAAGSAAAGASWLALVAATALGWGSLDRVRAEISSDSRLLAEGQGYRLIVQAYDPASMASDDVPSAYAKPLGSVQRAITAEELAQGIAVDVVQLGEADLHGERPVIVAWVEPGEPNLEFDALRARPNRDASCFSREPAGDDGSVRLVLKSRST